MRHNSTRIPFCMASALFIAANVQAAEGPDVYGKIIVTIQNTDNNGSDKWETKSNASRFGVKGRADLDAGLAAIYQMEWGVDVSDEAGTSGGAQNITSRDQYIGVSGSWGTITTGRFDTPLKKSQGSIDQFNDVAGDINKLLTRDVRLNNITKYASPVINKAFTVDVAVAPGETAGSEDSIADASYFMIKYEVDKLYAALGIERGYDAGSNAYNSSRLNVKYDFGDYQIGGIYQTTEPNTAGGQSENGYLISGAYKIDKNTLKAQIGNSDISDQGASQVSLGVDHSLGANTKVFVLYTDYSADDNTKDETIFGGGIMHSF